MGRGTKKFSANENGIGNNSMVDKQELKRLKMASFPQTKTALTGWGILFGKQTMEN